MKEVNFDLNLAVNPYVGIAVYENELITRLVKKYKDFKYVGTVCFNRENKKGLEKLNIPINTALAPYGMTFGFRDLSRIFICFGLTPYRHFL